MPDTRGISFGSPYQQPTLEDLENYARQQERLQASAQRQAEWEAMSGKKFQQVEEPWLNPVDSFAGGVGAFRGGLVAMLADMAMDVPISLVLEQV